MTATLPIRSSLPAMAAIALALLLSACGGSDERSAKAPAKPTGPTSPAAGAPAVDDADAKLANAVATGKTAAGVDLKYDVPAKPEPGQEFEIELAFLPRLPSDALEVEVTGIPGLEVLTGATHRFENVVPGERYIARVQVRAGSQGLYYVGVAARMVTQVQTDARTFSVPVVVGVPVASQKPAPEKDSAGQAIESLPATESGRDAP